MYKTDFWAFRRCEDDLLGAANSAQDWFLCSLTGSFGGRLVSYSPLGYEACFDKKPVDHAPCKRPDIYDN